MGWAIVATTSPLEWTLVVFVCLQVRRTLKACALPVYALFKNGRSRVVTVVRHIDGDVEEFAEEFKKVSASLLLQMHSAVAMHCSHVPL